MAKTVGSPIGIGALVVLNDQFGPGRIPKGVVRPVEKAVWESVLNRLESESQIRMVENQFNLAQARALIGGGLENVLRSAVKKCANFFDQVRKSLSLLILLFSS
ncbi:hypothetical protein PSTT_06018 [Puccinia striiformis]|uniref:Uncharacterized protein n=1 Tax=Puccinia striiformis TaxID=27350 RepID=A0A2S4VLZ1_9BASI|nr:hypothetical protein PSTT_06018 [Puccinia striiformis]